MKKSLRILAIGILLLLVMTGCQSNEIDNEVVLDIPEYPSDVIDWNLYSWQENGEWVFSIVDRYAGYDTFKEISSDEFKLPSIEHLAEALLNMPENSELFWTEHLIEGTVLPDTTLLYEILNYCNSIGVPVYVLN